MARTTEELSGLIGEACEGLHRWERTAEADPGAGARLDRACRALAVAMDDCDDLEVVDDASEVVAQLRAVLRRVDQPLVTAKAS